MSINIEPLGQTEDPTATGNAGVYIKPDGSIRMFQCFGVDAEDELSPGQLETGKKLMALIVALKMPVIMDILKQMAADPAIMGHDA